MKYTKTHNRRGEGKMEETHKGGSERLEGFANKKKKKHRKESTQKYKIRNKKRRAIEYSFSAMKS